MREGRYIIGSHTAVTSLSLPGDHSVKVVILQVGKDILFSTDLEKVAKSVGGIYAKIEDLSDISPTILKLTEEYTSLVDDDDLQVEIK